MRPKVLVTAASRHHATHEIGEAIAAVLIDRGIAAEASAIEQVTDLGEYGAVVLGSAVYANRWLGEARRFAQIHASELIRMPVWLFSSGPVGDPGHLIPAGVAADVPVLVRLTGAVGHRTFGGRLEMKSLHFAERAVVRTTHVPEGDSRDWDAVERFGGEIAEQLLGTGAAWDGLE
ncbi:MAG TPA: flavodoxin domain-containing protein [Solirubrobacteraceae bacterium]|nr:flavodoxin domain-containing protein [Solirubrobacteraceae bacterium]